MEKAIAFTALGVALAWAADKGWKLIRPQVIADEKFLLAKKDQIVKELQDKKVLITQEIHDALTAFVNKLK
jgi:hypothetical protein